MLHVFHLSAVPISVLHSTICIIYYCYYSKDRNSWGMKKVNKNRTASLNYKPRNLTVGKNKSSSFFTVRYSCFPYNKIVNCKHREPWRLENSYRRSGSARILHLAGTLRRVGTLTIETKTSSETSVKIYQYDRHHMPVDWNLKHRFGNLSHRLTCRFCWSLFLDVSSVMPWSLLPFAPWWLTAGSHVVVILWCLSSVCGLGGGLLLLRAGCWSALSSSVEGSVMVSTGVRRRLVGESLAWMRPSRDEVDVLHGCLLAVEIFDPVPSPLTSIRGFVGGAFVWNCWHSEGKIRTRTLQS